MTPADKLREAARMARDGWAFTDPVFGELIADMLDAASVCLLFHPESPNLTAPALALADALGVGGGEGA